MIRPTKQPFARAGERAHSPLAAQSVGRCAEEARSWVLPGARTRLLNPVAEVAGAGADLRES